MHCLFSCSVNVMCRFASPRPISLICKIVAIYAPSPPSISEKRCPSSVQEDSLLQLRIPHERVSWASLILEPVRPYELLEYIPLSREERLFPVNLLVHRARIVGGIHEFDRYGMHLVSHTPEKSLDFAKT